MEVNHRKLSLYLIPHFSCEKAFIKFSSVFSIFEFSIFISNIEKLIHFWNSDSVYSFPMTLTFRRRTEDAVSKNDLPVNQKAIFWTCLVQNSLHTFVSYARPAYALNNSSWSVECVFLYYIQFSNIDKVIWEHAIISNWKR